MKKVVLVIAIAGIAVSCKKIQAGSNKGVLKMEEGVERYSDDEMSDHHSAAQIQKTENIVSDSLKKPADTAKALKTEENH